MGTTVGRYGSPTPLLLCIAVAAAGACDRGEEIAPRPVAEAGLDLTAADIVVAREWPPAATLPSPELLYTGATGRGDPPLFRVKDLLPGAGGRYHVANSGGNEILFFRPDGRLGWTAGGRGEGPGEFKVLAGLQAWRGDTIVAIDSGRQIASFWDGAGALVETQRAGVIGPDTALGANVGFVMNGTLLGVLNDRRLAVRGPDIAYRLGESGLRRIRTALTIVDRRGEREAPVKLPGPWVYELSVRKQLPVVLAPMAVGTALDVQGDSLAWARDDAFEVIVFDPAGRVRRVFRIAERTEKPTAEVRRIYLDGWNPWFEVDEEIPFPPVIPTFDKVFFALDGDVWARRFEWRIDGPEEWVRFGAEGDGALRYRAPARVRIMGATQEAAYGVLEDDLDVEHIVRFDLLGARPALAP